MTELSFERTGGRGKRGTVEVVMSCGCGSRIPFVAIPGKKVKVVCVFCGFKVNYTEPATMRPRAPWEKRW